MFLIPPKAHTAYGSFEGNWVKTIKAIKRSFAKYWLCKREATGEGQPGDVTDLTGPWRAESRARSSVSYAPLTSYLHPVPANAEQQNKERSDKLISLFSLRKRHVQCEEGGRMVHPWRSLSPTWPRVDGGTVLATSGLRHSTKLSQFSSAQPEEGEKP